MHGKKFTAAEKHFHEKEVKYQRKIKDMQHLLHQQMERVAEADKENSKLIARVAQLEKQLEAAMTANGLTQEDVRTLVKKAETTNAIAGLLRAGSGLYA